MLRVEQLPRHPRAIARDENARTHRAFEILLLEENARNDWWTMMRPGKRARVGTQIVLTNPRGELTGIAATVIATDEEGHRRLHFSSATAASGFDISATLDALGELPLPPYIQHGRAARDARI